jgi:hypothetical protein
VIASVALALGVFAMLFLALLHHSRISPRRTSLSLRLWRFHLHFTDAEEGGTPPTNEVHPSRASSDELSG